MAGAKHKITPHLLETVRELLEEGHYATTVQRAIQVGDRTWYNWLNKGKEMEEKMEEENLTESDLTDYELSCYQFLQTVKEAEAVAEMKALNSITKASLKQWQAAAWYLERKFKDRWGRDVADNQGQGTALDKFLNVMAGAVENALAEEEEEE